MSDFKASQLEFLTRNTWRVSTNLASRPLCAIRPALVHLLDDSPDTVLSPQMAPRISSMGGCSPHHHPVSDDVITFVPFALWWNLLVDIVSLILLNLGHVFRFRIVSRMCFTKRLQSRPLNWPTCRLSRNRTLLCPSVCVGLSVRPDYWVVFRLAGMCPFRPYLQLCAGFKRSIEILDLRPFLYITKFLSVLSTTLYGPSHVGLMGLWVRRFVRTRTGWFSILWKIMFSCSRDVRLV